MRGTIKIFFLVFFFMSLQSLRAQDPTVKKDSASMYNNIEKYSKKRKFTKFIHKLIFRQTRTEQPKKVATKEKNREIPYRKYEGKIIRKINIVTLDPFGYSVHDTTTKQKNFIERAGNSLHFKTRQITIRNLLLIKKNQPLDSLLIKESQRLIRTQRYIREVTVTPETVSSSSDSIDLTIRVLDAWSLIPDASFSGSRYDIELREKNFFGTGHEFRNKYRQNIKDGDNYYRSRYYVPNIANTYINTTIEYENDVDDDFVKSINIERPFFSPYARWAGGIFVDQRYVSDSMKTVTGTIGYQRIKSSSQDFWAGHSIQVFKGNTEEDRATNFVSSIRYLRKRFQEAPGPLYDSINYYTRQDLYLISIGITSRKYIQDKYIFNYEIIEDVPIGRIFGITGGMQRKNHTNRLYLGSKVAIGNHYEFGYLSGAIEYGTFFRGSNLEDGALTFQATYFTNLIDAGKGRWKFRQFIKPQLVLGFKRNPYDNITINGEYGLPGFDGFGLIGTKKLLLSFQTQSYAPWELLGFRFGPFLSCTLGVLSDEHHAITNSKLYSQFGIGVLITNRYLVFNSFQVSFSFYPSIPGQGDNVLKSNSVKSTDFQFDDFQYGKPETVLYQ